MARAKVQQQTRGPARDVKTGNDDAGCAMMEGSQKEQHVHERRLKFFQCTFHA